MHAFLRAIGHWFALALRPMAPTAKPSFAKPPGTSWLGLLAQPSVECFAEGFTADVELQASVLAEALKGAVQVRAFFVATRSMYERVSFEYETSNGNRTFLEWSGMFHGQPVAGVTVLQWTTDWRIQSVYIHHRPLNAVIAFASELADRLASTGTWGGQHSSTHSGIHSARLASEDRSRSLFQ